MNEVGCFHWCSLVLLFILFFLFLIVVAARESPACIVSFTAFALFSGIWLGMPSFIFF
ncbi:hypothetical protein DsansV1_C23g0175821 [Dioscorea sansibarensis]